MRHLVFEAAQRGKLRLGAPMDMEVIPHYHKKVRSVPLSIMMQAIQKATNYSAEAIS